MVYIHLFALHKFSVKEFIWHKIEATRKRKKKQPQKWRLSNKNDAKHETHQHVKLQN